MPQIPLSIILFHLTIAAPGSAESWKIQPEAEDLFLHTGATEDGLYAMEGYSVDDLQSYVAANWPELLDHVSEIPTHDEAPFDAARMLGRAAEALPPMDYLDFIDRYLDVYQQGKVDDRLLESQLGGVRKKRNFLLINANYPRVAAIFKRAKSLVPETNVELQEELDEDASGNYDKSSLLNESGEYAPPETLPGVKIPTPYPSDSPVRPSKLASKPSSESGSEIGNEQKRNGDSSVGSSVLASNWLLFGAVGFLAVISGFYGISSRARRKR